LDCFKLFFSSDVIDLIIEQSKLYFSQETKKGKIKLSDNNCSTYYLFNKFGLKREDILSYFGAIIFMGINEKPEQQLHWDTDPFYFSQYLPSFISVSKFKMLREIFHLENNEIHKNEHCFFKISPLISYLCTQFRQFYIPNQCLSLDESLISYRGRSSFKFYMPLKPSKFGIKLHCVCESNSGYCLNCLLDPGKSDKNRIKTVDKLATELLKYFTNQFHIVFMDSFYSSIPLFASLYSQNTGATGLIKKSRKHLPQIFKTTKNTKPIEYTSNGTIGLVKWLDKKQLLCATTVHGKDEVISHSGSPNEKKLPQCISKYSENMRGVDLMDQCISIIVFGIAVQSGGCVYSITYLKLQNIIHT